MNILGGQSTPAAPANDLVKNGTDQTFMADVVEPSRDVPVLVDFWAPRCGPCHTLGPVIERAVKKAGGAVKLVKINIDENPGIAGQLRVQSIPAVFAFKDGQPVDGFMGALPESQIKEFIARVSGQVSEEEISALVERAQQALAKGDLGGAAQDFATALQMDKENVEAIAGLARVHITSGDPEQAKAILDTAPEPRKTAAPILAVRASIELAADAANAPELCDAETAVGANRDASTLFDLARAHLAAGNMENAVDALLDSIGADREWNEAAARRLLLRVFDAIGASAELARSGRRRLSTMLFS